MPDEERTFTQDDLNKFIGEARIKAREQARAEFEAQAAKDKEATERQALEAKQQWQELAGRHEGRVKELEPLEAEVEAYRGLVATMLADRVKALGEGAKKAVEALPGTLSDLEKLAWLNSNEELFQVAQPGDGVGTPHRKKGKQDDGPKGPTSRFPIRL
jgi:hypothetical protein